MASCQICGKTGNDLSLLYANHKELGYIGVCRECWAKMYNDNLFVIGSGSSGCCCG
ncbi:hypothetical protein KEJ26_04320 [Candidatus Bathyarchaeota archaeon]|nr:hypothetical protein [Candidatus Bathyarchaeota archaeon]